jgi:hypothetical protein
MPIPMRYLNRHFMMNGQATPVPSVAAHHPEANTPRQFMAFRSALVAPLRQITLALACASTSAAAIDARDRGFIGKGTPEGEVVFKIGKPDHEAFVRNVKGEPEVKTWTYFPHPRDPQTLTILTLHSGVVAHVERRIAR